MEIFDDVRLCFLVSGHTKNVCDGAFGNIRKRFCFTPVHFPSEMNKLINDSSDTTKFMHSYSVDWVGWKKVLQTIFTVPAGLKISTCHVFLFNKSSPGSVSTKSFSTSENLKVFKILKSSLSPSAAASQAAALLKETSFKTTWPRLQDIPSVKESNRRAYLLRYVCEQNFPTSDSFVEKFFSSGDPEM